MQCCTSTPSWAPRSYTWKSPVPGLTSGRLFHAGRDIKNRSTEATTSTATVHNGASPRRPPSATYCLLWLQQQRVKLDVSALYIYYPGSRSLGARNNFDYEQDRESKRSERHGYLQILWYTTELTWIKVLGNRHILAILFWSFGNSVFY